MTGPLAPQFAQVRPVLEKARDAWAIAGSDAALAALSVIERHVQDAVALLDECLNDGDRAWDPEELVAQMEKVRAALPAREKGA